jgi:branched-chain amino acid aminotransferase
VQRVDDRVLPEAPGPVTRRAAEVFAKRAADDVDP